ncbi:MAG: hypothetical protein E7146_02095 [Rikenellaceae bacterium]|nr:hypothetical protein [Rikenellaceae bacterium]
MILQNVKIVDIMKNMLSYLLLIVTLLVATSCVDKDADNIGITFDQSCDMTTPYAAEGETRNYTFTATTVWSVSTVDDWVSVEPSSGNARNKLFSVIVDKNPLGEPRSSYIIVTMGNGHGVKIDIEQEMTPLFLREDSTVYTIDTEGGDIDIEVSTNQEYRISIASPEAWLTSTVEPTRAMSDQMITLSASPNSSNMSRIAVVNIIGTDKSLLDSFAVIQSSADRAVNEIVYYTDDDDTVSLGYSDGFGATLRYHFFDTERRCGRMVFDEAVRVIPNNGFAGFANITALTLPERLQSIGNGAFTGCTGCSSFTIPSSVTQIGHAAFEGCSGVLITECNIPNCQTDATNSEHWLYGSDFANVEIRSNVGNKAFSGYAVESVTFSDGVATVSSDAFANCTELKQAKVARLSEWCNINFANAEANPLHSGNVALIVDGEELTTLNTTADVKRIGKYAFYNYTKLQSISLNDVETINWSAFERCSVESIYLGKRIASVGLNAFNECHAESLTIDFNMPAFSHNAESSNHWLCGLNVEHITIDEGASDIGTFAFNSLATLKSVDVAGSVESIGQGAFANCPKLMNVTIDDGVKCIDEHAFYNCAELTNIAIAQSVTTIAGYAFNGCSSLEAITIPEQVDYIGEYAFADCNNLEVVYCLSESPATLGNNYVFDANNNSLTIYVPASAVDAYRNANGWRSVANKISASDR